MTPAMTDMLHKRWPAYTKCLKGLFTALLVVCAFCGSCTFKNDPKQSLKFVKVAAEGARAVTCVIGVYCNSTT